MKVTVTGPVVKVCPYKDETDHGTVALTFDVADGDAPELHDLGKHLLWYADQSLSHEDFTRRLWIATGSASVRSTWTTAGLGVTVDVPGEPK